MPLYLPAKYLKKLTCLTAAAMLYLPLKSSAQTGETLFNHAAICSKDLKKSNAFYTSVLKLKIIPNPFKDTVHTWYSIAPQIQMHVIQSNCPTVDHSRGDHLCFSVPSIQKFITTLTEKKIPYCNWKGAANTIEHRADGVSQVYFQDPDGYWIEVNDAK